MLNLEFKKFKMQNLPFFRIFALISLLLFSACSNRRIYPDVYLSIVSTDFVDLSDVPDVSREYGVNSAQPLVVKFRSSLNLREVAVDGEYNFYVHAYYCDEETKGEESEILVDVKIYDSIGGFGLVTRGGNYSYFDGEYRVYIFSENYISGRYLGMSYNLLKDGRDVCIFINGGNMLSQVIGFYPLIVRYGDIVNAHQRLR